MKTLSKIYSDKETRNGIAVNKTYLVPVEQIYLEPGYNIREADEQHVEYFAQCWESGQPLPALTVIPDEKGIRILDGQHRYLGALRAIERGAPKLTLGLLSANTSNLKDFFTSSVGTYDKMV